MGYIRFNITRITDSDGRAIESRIRRIESDMPSAQTLETNIIWNALSLIGAACEWMKLDKGVLNRDMLGESDYIVLDRDLLDVDKLL